VRGYTALDCVRSSFLCSSRCPGNHATLKFTWSRMSPPAVSAFERPGGSSRYCSAVARRRPRRRQSRGTVSTSICLCLSVCFTAWYLKNRCSYWPPNLTYKCPTTRPGNPFILGSKGQRSWLRVENVFSMRGSLHSCECCLLLFLTSR